MEITRTEFRAQAAERHRKAERQRIPHLEFLTQAAIQAQYLTGDPNWDVFLQFLQGQIETAKEIKADFERDLLDPAVVSDEQMRSIKSRINVLNATISAWEAVIGLPTEIMENGETAKNLLEELGLYDDADAE